MLRVVAREWGRIGVTGFGGPPVHVAMLRQLVVQRRGWLSAEDFEDANAACQLLPGPASTQLAIYTASRVAGVGGAIVGGLCFVVPAVLSVLALSLLFLAESPPDWVRGAGAGAGAAVAAVAVHAGVAIARPTLLARVGADRLRYVGYALLGGAAAALLGAAVVLVLLACGAAELLRRGLLRGGTASVALPLAVVSGGLCWTALKVGALSYGGGFVIIPLMQHDAVDVHGWLTDAQFSNAVALGQVTPGPVVATIAAVGYGAAGVAGALVASTLAFAPSFLFVVIGGDRFDRLRTDPRVRAFLDGAGPAAAGAIIGASVPLARSLTEPWQAAVLAGAVVLLLGRRSVVTTLLAAAVAGVVIALAGGPLP